MINLSIVLYKGSSEKTISKVKLDMNYTFILYFLLLIGGIESNPGPHGPPSNFRHLKIIHNNVCSILPKLDMVANEFCDHDIICITETHLDDTIDIENLKLEGFQLPAKLNRNRHGGGVMIYVKNNLYFTVRHDLMVHNLEILWIEVTTCRNDIFLVGDFYRPPNSLASNSLWDLFNDL